MRSGELDRVRVNSEGEYWDAGFIDRDEESESFIFRLF
jgi:hypothetical protein